MKIVEIREKTVPISSPIRNAYIDFSKMTLSLVAVITDVVRDGKPVVGYGFNSNGRYGQGQLMRERFLPRLMEAKPDSLLDARGILDPHKVWDTLFKNEKPGGHGERSVAIGTIDMAVWDAVAEDRDKPLFQLLADRHGDGKVNRKVFVYAPAATTIPGKDDSAAEGRDAQLPRARLLRGEDEDRRRLAGRGPAPHRVGAVHPEDGQRLCVDANGRFDMDTGHRLRQGAVSSTTCSGTRRPATRWTTSCRRSCAATTATPWRPARTCSPCRTRATWSATAACGRTATGCSSTAPCRTAWSNTCARWRCSSSTAGRPRAACPHGGHQMSLNIAAGLGLGGNESYPGPVPALWRLPRWREGGDSYVTMPEPAGHRLRGQERPDPGDAGAVGLTPAA
jgi:hypothetical protein